MALGWGKNKGADKLKMVESIDGGTDILYDGDVIGHVASPYGGAVLPKGKYLMFRQPSGRKVFLKLEFEMVSLEKPKTVEG